MPERMRGAPKGTIQRTQLQLKKEILQFLQKEDRRKTAIVYHTGTNFRMTTQLLEELMRRGLIDQYFNGCHATFWITPAGEELLVKIEELGDLI